MKKQIIFSRITLFTSLFLLVFGLLYAKYGVWYGREQWNNFSFDKNVTIAELQEIHAKENLPSFLYFKFTTNLENDDAIIKFWEATKKTPISNNNEEASLELVKEIFPNAKDTLRETLYNESFTKKADMLMDIFVVYLALLYLSFKKLRILLTYIFFNCLYWLCSTTIGAILTLLLLNFVLLVSSLIKNIKSLQKIHLFNKLDILFTNTLWKWNFLKDLDMKDMPCFRFFIEGSLLLIVATVMIIYKNIGFLFNIPALFIILFMVSEINNIIYSNNN